MELADGFREVKTKVDIMYSSPQNTGDKMTSKQKTIDPIDIAHQRRREIGEQTRADILTVICDSDQPLITREIRNLYAQRFGRTFDQTYVRTVLQGLVADGFIKTRPETYEETLIRNNGRVVRGTHNASYFYSADRKVVKRTEASVDGLRLTGRAKKKSKRKAAPARKVEPAVQTGSLQSLLRARAAELEAELAAIRALLK
jgi:hypothetical protein